MFLAATMPHLDAVWSVARRMATDPSGAEDLVQETYLRAFRSFAQQGRGELRSWLVAICVNVARSEYRRIRRRPSEQLSAEPVAWYDPDGDAATIALARLDKAAVEDALGRLPEAQRTAIVMMDLAGLTAREVGEALGVPRGTILARVHRGRQRLAGVLEREGLRDGT